MYYKHLSIFAYLYIHLKVCTASPQKSSIFAYLYIHQKVCTGSPPHLPTFANLYIHQKVGTVSPPHLPTFTYLYIHQRVCTGSPPDSPDYYPGCSLPPRSLYATPWWCWICYLFFKSLQNIKTQNPAEYCTD